MNEQQNKSLSLNQVENRKRKFNFPWKNRDKLNTEKFIYFPENTRMRTKIYRTFPEQIDVRLQRFC